MIQKLKRPSLLKIDKHRDAIILIAILASFEALLLCLRPVMAVCCLTCPNGTWCRGWGPHSPPPVDHPPQLPWGVGEESAGVLTLPSLNTFNAYVRKYSTLIREEVLCKNSVLSLGLSASFWTAMKGVDDPFNLNLTF